MLGVGSGIWQYLLDPFKLLNIPLGVWVEELLNWTVINFRPVFQAIRMPVDWLLQGIEQSLQSIPPSVTLVIRGLVAWQVISGRSAIYMVAGMFFVGLVGVWPHAMTTLAIVFTSVTICISVGIPIGIFAARSDRFEAGLRPILDGMQTIPTFVYLVPVVMLFGIGNVPGTIVTIVFALPPVIRLTNLGIRQVSPDVVEAAFAFGASPRQLLYKVQFPLARPTIMAGVNQTLMMALSMVVVASMIAVGGLGQMVLRGIGRLDMGLATVGGLGIVILAIVLDRLTQAMGAEARVQKHRHWYDRGPVGLIVSKTRRDRT